MKTNNKTQIAGNLTIKDWEDLVGKEDEDLKINYENNKKWGLAFHFFEERIKTRYLNPIQAVLNIDLNTGEGFAVINLQCSLIETAESFINGYKYEYPDFIMPSGGKYKKGSVGIFKSFFDNREPFKSLKINGEDFYKSIRCALLHETQTKNNWKIKQDFEKKGKSFEDEDGFKIIYRENFQRDLEALIYNYKNAIINGEKFNGISACELRENFITKFNHICKQSL
ncbi:hypothetical protein [Flavobacterium sp.]|uniref:hypothetical protein n=1 Tax=Flavobacterium sp. TaxID=239 RepID=UPI00391A782C